MNERLDLIIRFLLCVLIFWLPYSPAVVEICVIASVILWIFKRGLSLYAMRDSSSENLFRKFLRAFRPAPSFLDVPIGIFLFICIISIPFSRMIEHSLHGFITKTLEWFVIYYLVLEVFTKRRAIYAALGIFIFTAFSTAIDSIVQYYFLHRDIFLSNTLDAGRATAGFHYANSLAGYLTIIVPLVVSLFFLPMARPFYRIFSVVILAAVAWSLAITFSRMGWVAAFCGILFLFFIMRRYVLLGAVLMSLSIMLYVLSLSSSLTPLESRFSAENLESVSSWRARLWRDSLKMIEERPLLGHGLNTYMRLFQDYREKFLDHYDFH